MRDSFAYWHFRTILAWALVVMAITYFTLTADHFLSLGNLFALTQTFAVLALVATGLTMVMLMGQFDLAITAVFPLTGLVAVKISTSQGPVAGIAAALVLGAVIGLLNGLLTALFDIPSLAVTIGTMVAAIGLGYFITGGKLVFAEDYETGLRLTNPVAGVLSLQSIIELGTVAVLGVALSTTWHGRYVYAIGSDARRARASGIPVVSMLVIGFVISGSCTALGGALQGTALATGQAGTNDAFLLQAATAAILGGVALAGGRGNLLGVVGAALFLAVLSNGLSLVGADSATVQFANGLILLMVVVLHTPLTKLISAKPVLQPFEHQKENSLTI